MVFLIVAALAAIGLTGDTPAGTDRVEATFRGGVVHQSDLESWRNFTGAPVEGPALRGELRQIVLLHEFAALLEENATLESRDYTVQRRQLERELAVSELKVRLRTEARPNRADLLAYYNKNLSQFSKPKRWRLSNILIEVPDPSSPSARSEARATIDRVAAQLKAGAAFETLAFQYSESTTAARGGRAGYVTLDQLAPEAAKAVENLDVGDISDVIASKYGFTIVRCTHILPAGALSFDLAQKRIQERVNNENYQKALAKLESEVRSKSSLTGVDLSWLESDRSSQAVLTYRWDRLTEEVGLDEYLHFLKSRDVQTSAAEMKETEHEKWIDELLLEIGLARLAKQQGLLDTDGHRDDLQWNLMYLAAHIVLQQRVSPAPVSDDDIAAHYEKHKPRFRIPAASHIVGLIIRLDESTPRGVVDRARQTVHRLRVGEITIAEAPVYIDPAGVFVRLREYGWMNREQLFYLGAGPQKAAEALEVGQTSDLVQDGPKLMILHCDKKRGASQQTLDQARPMIEEQLSRTKLNRAQRKIETEILSDAHFEVVPPTTEATPAAEEHVSGLSP